LRSTEASLVMLIGANPGVRQSELGRVLDIKRANMSPLIAKLEERDLICRTPIDGRSTGLSLSGAGAVLRGKVQQVVAAHEAALIARVNPALRDSFVEALRMLWT
jgi:DNA-binding MarR family transcriptional regulator